MAASAPCVYKALHRRRTVPPSIVTDGLSLLQRLEAGRVRATAEYQPLARIWNLIFQVLDSADQITQCINSLCWMPSHTSRQAIGHRTKSDGTPVNATDWRANRLVDAAAKASAFRFAPQTKLALLLGNTSMLTMKACYHSLR